MTALYRATNLAIENSRDMQLHYGSFTFNKNILTIIQGKSGIGKTTLLRVLGLLSRNIFHDAEITLHLDNSDSGHALKSLDWQKAQELRQAHFGYIFQDDHLVDSISVHDNILFPSLLTGNDIDGLTKTLSGYLYLPFLNPIKDRMDESCATLSGGEKKKVALLRAILKDPDILVADEPWTNLGGNQHEGDVKGYIDFFIQQRKHKSTILATHDEEVIQNYNQYDFVEAFELVEIEESSPMRKIRVIPINP
ncbi:MAG: ATP-binding cassette domain-containing protein [Acidobacteria bacterium]|nr:ATP-binding cassette domain-containing protein [Acidobacteriota bacterium]